MVDGHLHLVVVCELLATFLKLSMEYAIVLQNAATERFNDDSLDESYVNS